MGKLSDILASQGQLDDISSAWDTVTPAPERDALPRGAYVADIVAGDAIESRSNHTPGYRLTFDVVEGEHTGARFWHDCWFTEKAMPRTKRDLAKLGVTELTQLEQPLPAIFRCKVDLVRRCTDDGFESNQIRRFEVIEVRQPEPDPFAPDAAELDSNAGSDEHEGAA